MFSRVWSSKLSEYYSKNRLGDRNSIPISKINVIIGANNTGKSRFIRALFSSDRTSLVVEDINKVKLFSKQLDGFGKYFPTNGTLGNLRHDQVKMLFEGQADTFNAYKDALNQH